MEQRSESLKSLADQLARHVVSHDGMQVARLLRLTSFLETPPESADTAFMSNSGRVGIWELKRRNGRAFFRRSRKLMDEWHHWANVGVIEPKGERLRVVLLGESVARGYLYDPLYTPAMVLEQILQSVLGRDAVEVIDLARTSIGLEIRDVAIAAAALEPDAVVMFCANNWRCDFPVKNMELPYLSTAVRERGVVGYKEYAETILRNQAENVIDDVSSFYSEKGIPILWIVPEFNLDDWRDPVGNAPHLFGDNNRKWLECREMAQRALASGDLLGAARASREMIGLDLGTSPTGYYLLAESSRRAGELETAYGALQSARDASAWDASNIYAPRTISLLQRALRAAAKKYNNEVVDSPKLFKELLGGGIPDRRLFLDYCHLSAEGIKVTMAAAASSLVRSLQGADASWRDLLADASGPSCEAESEAHFLAAIHNAHWWQSNDLVEHHATYAARRSQHILPIMAAYLELQTRRTPLLMCATAEKIQETGSPQIQHYLFRYNHQQLDEVLITAFSKVLGDAGGDARRDVEKLRIEEHSVTVRDINLLDYYYNSSARQPYEMAWVTPTLRPPERHYYRAFSSRSKFVFVGESGCPVRLDLTCRIPYLDDPEASIVLYLNGAPIGDLNCCSTWERLQITLPGEVVWDGLNNVVLAWPPPRFPGAQAIERMADEITLGKFFDPYCPFGEIHVFTASREREIAPADSKHSIISGKASRE